MQSINCRCDLWFSCLNHFWCWIVQIAKLFFLPNKYEYSKELFYNKYNAVFILSGSCRKDRLLAVIDLILFNQSNIMSRGFNLLHIWIDIDYK